MGSSWIRPHVTHRFQLQVRHEQEQAGNEQDRCIPGSSKGLLPEHCSVKIRRNQTTKPFQVKGYKDVLKIKTPIGQVEDPGIPLASPGQPNPSGFKASMTITARLSLAPEVVTREKTQPKSYIQSISGRTHEDTKWRTEWGHDPKKQNCKFKMNHSFHSR